MEENHWVEDWLSAKAESPKTRKGYSFCWFHFKEFCSSRGKNADKLVEDYRQAKYQGEVLKEQWIEEWQDLVRTFPAWLKPRYASLTQKLFLTVVKSYMKFWKIPVDVDLPKHACVTFHNRDLKKAELKQILTFASPRDRVIWGVMAESGMRADTAVNLQYWQIKEDFEAEKVPMKLLLPSSVLKDHVGDRWTFIGEDGFRELSEYLKKRLPLENDAYVFLSEKAGKVKGEQFSPASLSVKFNDLVQRIGIDKSRGKREEGKAPKLKEIRLHGLRKYFRNNMKADSSYIAFWMGHSLGTDAHYISRDIEEHRKRYAEGYPSLKVSGVTTESLAAFSDLLTEKDAEIKELRSRVEDLTRKINTSTFAGKSWDDLVRDTEQHLFEHLKRVGEGTTDLKQPAKGKKQDKSQDP